MTPRIYVDDDHCFRMFEEKVSSARQRYLARKSLLYLALDIKLIKNCFRSSEKLDRASQVRRSPFDVVHHFPVHSSRVDDDACNIRRKKIAHHARGQTWVAVHEGWRRDFAGLFLYIAPLFEEL